MDKKKNILIFTGMYSTKYGAFERYNVKLSKQIQNHGYQAIFIYNEMPAVKAYLTDLSAYAEVIELNPKTSLSVKIRDIVRLLKMYKPKIVHTHFNPSIIRLVIFLSFIFRVPKRYNTFHCMAVTHKLVTKIWMFLLNVLCTKTFAISDAIRNEQISIFKISKSKIKTINLGLENKIDSKKNYRKKLFLEHNLPPDSLLIGVVATHNHIKGLDTLLDAFKLVLNNHKNVFLFQIGDDTHDIKYTSFLKNKVESLGMFSNVKWLGTHNNVPNLLTAFDIYIQPSRMEGLGLAILEAFYAKKPVIATNVGGIPEVVNNENGILVEKENPILLANAIMVLLNSKKLRQTKGSNGFIFVEQSFNIKTQIKKLVNTYYIN